MCSPCQGQRAHYSFPYTNAIHHAVLSPLHKMVQFLTLCFLSSDFGEEGDLSHGHKWQTQDLQKNPNDELSQLPWETTCRKHHKHWMKKQDTDKFFHCQDASGLTFQS